MTVYKRWSWIYIVWIVDIKLILLLKTLNFFLFQIIKIWLISWNNFFLVKTLCQPKRERRKHEILILLKVNWSSFMLSQCHVTHFMIWIMPVQTRTDLDDGQWYWLKSRTEADDGQEEKVRLWRPDLNDEF